MSGKWRVRILTGLIGAVLAAAIYFPILKRRVKRQAQLQEQSEEQARRDLVQSLASTANEPMVKAKLFWASEANDSELIATTVDLPLASDPVLRSKQVLNTLLAGPVDAELRTLPPDAALLAFYILADGTAIADFSEAMANSLPSGVESEQLAVDSITRTLEANVPQVKRLKILIHGQEAETLAGHLDLTGVFPVNSKASQLNSASPAAAAGSPTGTTHSASAPGAAAKK